MGNGKTRMTMNVVPVKNLSRITETFRENRGKCNCCSWTNQNQIKWTEHGSECGTQIDYKLVTK